MRRYLLTSVLIMACALPVAVSVYTVGQVFAAESAAAKENLEKLKATKSCRGCDLAGLVLNRLDLVDADLEGADLSSARLSLTNLTRANLKNTNLRGTVFGGTDLSDADLRGADLRGASLDSSYYQGARFDGEFIAAKPYEDVGETEIAKEVFVADPVKPKQNPEKREVKMSDRSDHEASPPTVAPVREAKPEAAPVKLQEVRKDHQTSDPESLAAPVAKKVAPVQQAIVDVSVQDENVAAAAANAALPVPVKEEIMKQVSVEPKISVPVAKPIVNVPEQNIKGAMGVTPPQPSTRAKASTSEKVNEEKPIIESGVGSQSRKPPAGKTQQDNFARLLDTNRCYGCDLSGLDLSGKNLDGADLEKANLSGCNLEKVDLEKANLKSALLVKANLRQASLKMADFYKADLTGADLSGAKVAGATFDSAQTASAVGLKESIEAAGK